MANLKPPKRVTILTRSADGTLSVKAETTPGAGNKKKGTKGLALVEKILRTGVDVSTAAGDSYLERHKRSNEKNKDGWLENAPANVVRSGLKGMKKAKIRKLI